MPNEFFHLKPSFKYSNEIKQISHHLKSTLRLDLLNFSRFFKNGTSLGLYSHPEVIENLLRSRSAPLILNQDGVILDQGGYFFSEVIDFISLTLSDEALTRYQNSVMKLGYEFRRGYLIILKTSNYTDVFFFSYTQLNPIEERFYISQIKSELLQFCYFYLDKMSKIIGAIRPDNDVQVPKEKRKIPHHLLITTREKEQFKTLTRPKRYQFQLETGSVSLSQREFQTLVLFVQGFTYKAISELLGVSKRTIESYGLNIKNKLGNSNRQDLYHLLSGSIYNQEILPGTLKK